MCICYEPDSTQANVPSASQQNHTTTGVVAKEKVTTTVQARQQKRNAGTNHHSRDNLEKSNNKLNINAIMKTEPSSTRTAKHKTQADKEQYAVQIHTKHMDNILILF